MIVFARGHFVSPYARDMSSMIFTNTYRPDTSSGRRILTLCCRAVGPPVFTVREPWSSFLPSTAHGALLGRDGRAWPCLSGSARQWLLPTLVQGGDICGPERCAGRRALPPLDIKCSTEWHSLPGGTRWTLLMPLLKASPPMATTGGPAVDPAHRATLQLQSRHWSLPPDVVCLSACFRRCA